MSRLAAVRRLGRSVAESGLSFFLSQGCAVCDCPGHRSVCLDCQRQIQDLVNHYEGWTIDPEHPLLIGALGPYGGAIKQALRALKYERRREVGSAFGMALGKQWLQQQTRVGVRSRPLYALPIPLHRHRQAQRGYNQAEVIARSFCQISGLPLLADGLSRVEDTLPQYQLGLKARQENLKGAFRVGRSLQQIGKRLGSMPEVLLVDDIYTSGTTARSAVDVLRRSRVPVVGMVAVARAIGD
ncbi:MAG: ComF family protein [Cyanobacteria bacterium P01_D01_bin.1]